MARDRKQRAGFGIYLVVLLIVLGILALWSLEQYRNIAGVVIHIVFCWVLLYADIWLLHLLRGFLKLSSTPRAQMSRKGLVLIGICSAIPPVVVYFLLGEPALNLLRRIVMACAVLLVLYLVIYNIRGQRRAEEIASIPAGRPKELIAYYEEKLNRYQGKRETKRRFERRHYYINHLSVALNNDGQFQREIELLQSVEHEMKGDMAAANYNNLAVACYEIDRYDDFRKYKQLFVEQMGHRKGEPAFVQSAAYLTILEGMLNGEYEAAIPFFTDRYDKASEDIYRVGPAYMLGVVYDHMKEHEEAEECFRFVAEYGEDLHIAHKSREWLGNAGPIKA